MTDTNHDAQKNPYVPRYGPVWKMPRPSPLNRAPDVSWTNGSIKLNRMMLEFALGKSPALSTIELRGQPGGAYRARVPWIVLRARSPYFEGMSGHDVQETTTANGVEIPCSDACLKAIVEFLCTGTLQSATDADAREVWIIAHLYQVQGACEWVRYHGTRAMPDLLAAANFAYAMEGGEINCEKVMESCLYHVKRKDPPSACPSEEMLHVHPEAMRRILESALKPDATLMPPQAAKRNEHAFVMVQRWHESNLAPLSTDEERQSLQSEARNLLDLVSFRGFSKEVLDGKVRPSGLLPSWTEATFDATIVYRSANMHVATFTVRDMSPFHTAGELLRRFREVASEPVDRISMEHEGYMPPDAVLLAHKVGPTSRLHFRAAAPTAQ